MKLVQCTLEKTGGNPGFDLQLYPCFYRLTCEKNLTLGMHTLEIDRIAEYFLEFDDLPCLIVPVY